MPARILVVEDDVVSRHLLTRLLQTEGHSVVAAAGYHEGAAAVNAENFDLILLDLMFADGDGLELCRRIRSRRRTPIIIITSRGEAEDVVTGLELGADDYVVKPVNVDVLAARVRAHLRRATMLRPGAADDRTTVGDVIVDTALRDAVVGGKPAGLTQKEFELLALLARRSGRAVSREEIAEELFDGEIRSDKILAVYVRRLRQKIERDPDHPELLHTLRGFGYRLGTGGS